MEERQTDDWAFRKLGPESGIELTQGYETVPDVAVNLFAISGGAAGSAIFAAAGPEDITVGKVADVYEALIRSCDVAFTKIAAKNTLYLQVLANGTQIAAYNQQKELALYGVDGAKQWSATIDGITSLKSHPTEPVLGYVCQDAAFLLSGTETTRLGSASELCFDNQGTPAFGTNSAISYKSGSIAVPTDGNLVHLSFVGASLLCVMSQEDEYTTHLYTDGEWTEVSDACPPYGDDSRHLAWYSGSLQNWVPSEPLIVVAAASRSTDMLLATPADVLSPNEDVDRASMPFNEETEQDLSPTGAALFTGLSMPPPRTFDGVEETAPMPIWLVLTNTGTLTGWAVLSREALKAGLSLPVSGLVSGLLTPPKQGEPVLPATTQPEPPKEQVQELEVPKPEVLKPGVPKPDVPKPEVPKEAVQEPEPEKPSPAPDAGSKSAFGTAQTSVFGEVKSSFGSSWGQSPSFAGSSEASKPSMAFGGTAGSSISTNATAGQPAKSSPFGLAASKGTMTFGGASSTPFGSQKQLDSSSGPASSPFASLASGSGLSGKSPFGALQEGSAGSGSDSDTSKAGTAFNFAAKNESPFGTLKTNSGSAFTSNEPPLGQSESKSIFGQMGEKPSIFGQASGKPSVLGQANEKVSPFGQASEKPSLFGQPSEKPSIFGQASEKSTLFGQPSEKPSIFGQPSEKPSIFGQTNEKSSLFGQPSEKPSLSGQASEKPSAPDDTSEKPSLFGQSSDNPSPLGKEAREPSPSGLFGEPSSEKPSLFTPSDKQLSQSGPSEKPLFGQTGESGKRSFESPFAKLSTHKTPDSFSFGASDFGAALEGVETQLAGQEAASAEDGPLDLTAALGKASLEAPEVSLEQVDQQPREEEQESPAVESLESGEVGTLSAHSSDIEEEDTEEGEDSDVVALSDDVSNDVSDDVSEAESYEELDNASFSESGEELLDPNDITFAEFPPEDEELLDFVAPESDPPLTDLDATYAETNKLFQVLDYNLQILEKLVGRVGDGDSAAPSSDLLDFESWSLPRAGELSATLTEVQHMTQAQQLAQTSVDAVGKLRQDVEESFVEVNEVAESLMLMRLDLSAESQRQRALPFAAAKLQQTMRDKYESVTTKLKDLESTLINVKSRQNPPSVADISVALDVVDSHVAKVTQRVERLSSVSTPPPVSADISAYSASILGLADIGEYDEVFVDSQRQRQFVAKVGATLRNRRVE